MDTRLKASATLKPGITFKDVHLPASISLFERLKDLNLVKGDPKEAVRVGAHTMFSNLDWVT